MATPKHRKLIYAFTVSFSKSLPDSSRITADRPGLGLNTAKAPLFGKMILHSETDEKFYTKTDFMPFLISLSSL